MRMRRGNKSVHPLGSISVSLFCSSFVLLLSCVCCIRLDLEFLCSFSATFHSYLCTFSHTSANSYSYSFSLFFSFLSTVILFFYLILHHTIQCFTSLLPSNGNNRNGGGGGYQKRDPNEEFFCRSNFLSLNALQMIEQVRIIYMYICLCACVCVLVCVCFPHSVVSSLQQVNHQCS